MSRSTTLMRLAVLLGCLLTAFPARAADRTVCFTLKFRDDRTDCPTPGILGARRACNTTAGVAPSLLNSSMIGHDFELWDKDADGNDEFVHTFRIRGSGEVCATVPWEGTSVERGEPDPDFYVVYTFKVSDTSCGSACETGFVTDSNDARVRVSFRDNQGGSDPDRWVASNCTSSSDCHIPGTMLVDPDSSTRLAGRAMVADTAQHMFEVFGDHITQSVALKTVPDTFDGCDGPFAFADSRSVLVVCDTKLSHGADPAHELGHCLHLQVFERDNLDFNYLFDDPATRDDDGHMLGSQEFEAAATIEGWAQYVAAVSWWDPENTGSSPTHGGYSISKAAPVFTTRAKNARNEIQVARAFWDLDDRQNELSIVPCSGGDHIDASTSSIVAGWSFFANGTADHKKREAALNPDGGNLKDYLANNASRFSLDFEATFIEHNCLVDQDE